MSEMGERRQGRADEVIDVSVGSQSINLGRRDRGDVDDGVETAEHLGGALGKLHRRFAGRHGVGVKLDLGRGLRQQGNERRHFGR